MPHHSKQGSAAGGGAYGATGSSANGSLNTQKSFPPTDYSAGSQQSTTSRRNSFPASTSMPSGASTEFQHQQPQQQSHFHRVPASPPESLPKQNKQGETETSESAPPPTTLTQPQLPSDHHPSNNNINNSNRDDQDDHGDAKNDRIVANNVLLLAAAASKERNRIHLEEQQQQQDMDDDNASHGADTIATSGSTSNGPLKKRKTVGDILRPKTAAEDHQNHHQHPADPYHVSPMSQGSKSSASATLMGNESTTPDSAKNLGSTSRALSYESKEEATSSANSSKNSTPVHNTSSILKKSSAGGNTGNSNHSSPKCATQFPPSHTTTMGGSSNTRTSLVPYFPSALHWLLTESSSQTASPEYAAARSVLQWVPHGQAWRVVRWDALRKQVLPQFFPQLAGSVDCFLWHLAAWGFEEIQDGPDVGAFGHTLFRRGHPQLCQEMKFAPEILEGANTHGPSDDSRSILRVPSLATAGSGETPSPGADPQDKDQGRSSASSSYTGTPPTNARHRSPFGHRGGGWATSPSSVRANVGPPIYVNYRPEDMAEAWAHQYSNYPGKQGPPTPGPWMHSHAGPTPHHGVGGNAAALHSPQGMPPYSPIRIRSGRGARRMTASAGIRHSPSSESTSTVSTMAASSTRSFPVSNRGKGRRNIAASLPNNIKSSSHNNPEGSEGLTMLAKMGEQQQQQQQELKPQETGSTNEESERRNILKRKLPLSSSATSTTKVETASTGD